MKNKKKIIQQVAYLIPDRKLRRKFKAYFFNKYNIYQTELANAYEHLSRYYVLPDIACDEICMNVDYRTLPIWRLWLQGKQNAPALVQKCMQSVEKYGAGREIIVLTEQNLHNYADVPGHIWDKYRAGVIENAHFSDVIRSLLLEKHGGTWIDATVLLTAPIPELVLQQSFFAFSYENHKEVYKMDYFTFGNWFMHSQPGHLLFKKLNIALANHWQNENKAVHYFMYYVLVTGLINNDPVLAQIWRQTPRYSEIPTHVLLRSFLHKYDAQKLDEIKAGSTIHKLSYFTKEQKKMNKYKNKFLDVFLNTDIIA